MKYLFLSPKQCLEAYSKCLKELSIRISFKDIDLILAPLYGGIWFGKHLSDDTGIPVEFIPLSISRQEFCVDLHKKYKEKTILLVDDIYDTGETFKYFINNFEFKSVVCAALLTKNFYAEKISVKQDLHSTCSYDVIYGKYIPPVFYAVFPWEKEFEEIEIGLSEMKNLRDTIQKSKENKTDCELFSNSII